MFVIDTVAGLGGAYNDAKEYMDWHATYVEPFLHNDLVNIGVLALDHEAKNREGPKTQIGTVMKRNSARIQYHLAATTNRVPGRYWQSELILGKDNDNLINGMNFTVTGTWPSEGSEHSTVMIEPNTRREYSDEEREYLKKVKADLKMAGFKPGQTFKREDIEGAYKIKKRSASERIAKWKVLGIVTGSSANSYEYIYNP